MYTICGLVRESDVIIFWGLLVECEEEYGKGATRRKKKSPG